MTVRRSLRSIIVGLAVLGIATFVAMRVDTRKPRRPPLAVDFPPRSPVRLLHVVDGDTAYFVLSDGRRVKGRLAGINTPECHKERVKLKGGGGSARCARDDEFFGLKAYRILLDLLKGTKLKLDCERKRDGSCRRGTHGRVLVFIEADGKNVAEQMALRGAGWSYTKYPSRMRRQLCQAELKARRARRGMWAHGTVGEVMAMMRPRTRKWYQTHDKRCARARR